MSDSIYSGYPPELSPIQQECIVSTVKEWAINNGLTVRPSAAYLPDEVNSKGVFATNAPVTLFPSPFPKNCFEDAKAVQTAYNELYAAISRNETWLGKIMEDLIDVDDFVSNLWKVHLAVKKEGYVQPLSLGLFRSDYMVHTPETAPPSLKQVEFNTIASSFGGLSSLVAQLHTNLLSFPPGNPVMYPPHPILKDNLPPQNTAVSSLASGLAASHEAYGAPKSSPALPLCIIFLVQEGERNIFDQTKLSSYLTEERGIPVFRLISSEVMKATSIPSSNPARPLIYTPPQAPSTQFEVTTVYLRSLYTPNDYQDSNAWEARTHLERSAAIKCPTVLTQLAGCKKIQQVLAEPSGPDHLSQFLPNTNPAVIEKVRQTFAPQYDLSPDGPGIKLALDPSTAENHVLKPQREGGGNNMYKSAIPGFLRSIPETEWKRWVLMELIRPPNAAKNTALRSDGAVMSGNVVGELGIFGTVLWNDDGKILQNEQGGWLMRTKAKESDEGGVAAGFSSLDSILLV
ncbi:hypothetical protein FQN54_007504 [Arachnomyces sp. PD_36]|nr:hypothetical protein FQN54_007504 [Arachnomyces sp. PD_36]